MSEPRRRGSPTLEPRHHDRTTPNGRHSTGARAVADGGRRRRRGLWPLLLGVLALLGIVALLAALVSGDDDDASTGSGQATQEQGQGAKQQQGQAGGASAGAADGTLTAGGGSILPDNVARIGDTVGKTAQGQAVVVQSVVRNAEDPSALEGFWVGSGEQDRVYVEWGGDVGADEATFQPEAGQRVNLEGPVKAAPQEAARVLNLDEADARLVEQQGAYVNAERVTAAR